MEEVQKFAQDIDDRDDKRARAGEPKLRRGSAHSDENARGQATDAASRNSPDAPNELEEIEEAYQAIEDLSESLSKQIL